MDVIQLLTTAYPQGLGEKNCFGETPFTSTYTNEVRSHLCYDIALLNSTPLLIRRLFYLSFHTQPAPALRVSAWDTNAQAASDSKAADSPLHRFSTPTGTYSGMHKS